MIAASSVARIQGNAAAVGSLIAAPENVREVGAIPTQNTRKCETKASSPDCPVSERVSPNERKTRFITRIRLRLDARLLDDAPDDHMAAVIEGRVLGEAMRDLVEQLRDERFTHPPRGLLLQAADEIERLRSQLASAKSYVNKSIASYQGDPADNNFQRGFLAALEVVRDEAFPQTDEQRK